ncbi:MAG TPA: alpha/beta hydrolase, partial [Pyrinomonadaceae bacterium]
MSRRLGVWACLAALALPHAYATARQSERAGPQPPPRRSMSEVAKLPVVYSLPGMDEVVVKPDLKYTDAGGPHLLMDVYVPPRLRRGERRPAVLFIHGSVPPGSRAKDMGVFRSWGRLAAASGMVGVTFTHRLGYPNPRLAEADSDLAAAVNYVRSNAASLSVDPDRVCLAAYSGGGPLLSAALRDRPAYVRCLVAFYAFLDIRQSEPHRAHESPDALTKFSPAAYLAGDAGRIAPVFVARAGLDEVPALNDSVDRFAREAIAGNAAVTVVNHPRGVHAFDILTDDERSREIIRAALDFMKTHLGVGGPGDGPARRAATR